MDRKTINAKQQQFLWDNHILYYSEPLPLEKGEGSYVWDVEGNKYLDFFAGILTTSVGHNNPNVNRRVHEQVDKLIHTSTLYPHQNSVELAERIAGIAPGTLSTSYFTASGTESNETAILLAKAFTGSQEVVALRNGYSGRSALAMGLTGQSGWRIAGTHVIGIKHAIAPYCYRCPLKMSYPECDVACAQDIENVIKTTTSGRIAAFIAEPIQGVGGFVTPPPEYFKLAAEIIRHYGGLYISDEVQTGFGRCGDHWWGIEHSGVTPDIMTMAKGIANGFPLANTITTTEIAGAMRDAGGSISTFGGNPVSTAAGLGVMETLESEAPPNRSADIGGYFRNGLDELWEKYPLIGEVRGRGLMQGVEMVTDRQSKEPAVNAVNRLFEETRQRGLLIGKGGMYGNVLRIAPALTATKEHVDEALLILDHALAAVHEQGW